jgi:hypothetical protein
MPNRIHLVYPHGPRISAPDSIGRELGKRLSLHYETTYYNWDDRSVIDPSDDDILLGHAHPSPRTIFRRSVHRGNWRRILMLSPYHHGDSHQVAFLDRVISSVDLYLAITGNYWFQTIQTSIFSHWLPKMRHMNMAVNRDHFPVVKTRFNPPGNRRFLYIGSSHPAKNLGYLQDIIKQMPNVEFGWIGNRATDRLEGVTHLGFQDFQAPSARDLISGYDFMLIPQRFLKRWLGD